MHVVLGCEPVLHRRCGKNCLPVSSASLGSTKNVRRQEGRTKRIPPSLSSLLFPLSSFLSLLPLFICALLSGHCGVSSFALPCHAPHPWCSALPQPKNNGASWPWGETSELEAKLNPSSFKLLLLMVAGTGPDSQNPHISEIFKNPPGDFEDSSWVVKGPR